MNPSHNHLYASQSHIDTLEKHHKFMSNKKFNSKTKTKGWFPIAKYLFKTEKHPVRQSTLKCSSSVEEAISVQETQMIEGITSSLQCNEREAIRIALYEASRRASEAYEGYFECARWDTDKRGHTARSRAGKWSLPRIEKDETSLAAQQLKISEKEFIRLAIIWLARGIKDESIIRLTKTPRIPKDEVAMNWSRENRGKPPSESVKKLKDARDKAKELSDYLFEQKRESASSEYEFRNGLPSELLRQIDDEDMDLFLENQSWEQDFLGENQDIDDIEFLIHCKMRAFQCSYEDAKFFVEGDLKEFDMLVKMTSKEQLQYLKQKDLYMNSPSPKEAELIEHRRKREEELEESMRRREEREKTWTDYVETRRLERRMIGCPEPYPHLPNPLPKDYPMPDDWNPEHLG